MRVSSFFIASLCPLLTTWALGCGGSDTVEPADNSAASGQPADAPAQGGTTAQGGAVGALGGDTSGGMGGVMSAGGGGATSMDTAGAGGEGAGGATPDADGWVKIFNGRDLTGWSPLIHKSAYKEDPYNTFRADPENQVLRVTYEDYPNNDFDERCGLLYYDKYLTNYRVRVTYRFLEPQAANPVGWGKNNSGLMIFGIDPAEVTGDPKFPPVIEIQILGTPSSGGTTNGNLCTPGGMTMMESSGGCGDNNTGVPALPAGDWVTIEAEVLVDGETKVYQHPDLENPVLTMSGPMYNGEPVLGGYLSLQTESQPLEFKDIELKELDL